MQVVNVKSSNYVGQDNAKEEEKRNQHFSLIDKDLQNLRTEVNSLIRYVRGDSWNDINFGAVSLGKGASSPDFIALSSTNLLVAGFDGSVTTEQLYGCLELLHSYKEGSDLSPHLHWFPSTNGTGNVKWQLEYSITQHDGVAIQTSTTLSVNSSATGVAWLEKRAEFPDISGTNLMVGNQFVFRLFRNPSDGADNYGSDAGVLTFGIHFKQNTLGSSSEWSK